MKKFSTMSEFLSRLPRVKAGRRMLMLILIAMISVVTLFNCVWCGWNAVRIGTCPGWLYQVVGDGRNDGIQRVYVSGFNGHIYEWTYLKANLGPPYTAFAAVAIGEWTKRWYDMNRVYCPDGHSPYLREYSWNSSYYEESVITLPSYRLCKAAVGSGRNDLVNRVYVSCGGGYVYELTYSAGNWQQVDICPSAPMLSRYGLWLGRTKSDSKNSKIRVYTTAQFGNIREHSWDGSAWVDTVVDAVTGASADLTVGRGRNDDTNRIYATHRNGSIYEFTNTDPYVGVKENPKLEVYPNPFAQMTEIRFQILNGTPKMPVSVRVYDMAGRLVKTLIDKKENTEVYTVVWNREDDFGNRVASGIYFCKLETGKSISFKKLVMLNGN
ncbi:MAG: T9SS type A sorting domain-containing protein [bacterium]|nr:T9SS type A sorting domain-containing protein [bacterium]